VRAAKGWSRHFDDPIPLPRGRQLNNRGVQQQLAAK